MKFFLFIIFFFYFNNLIAMDKPYHHVYKGDKLVGFRNLPADVPTWGKKMAMVKVV